MDKKMSNKKPQCKKNRPEGISKRYLIVNKKNEVKKMCILLRGHQKRNRNVHDGGKNPIDFDCTRGSIDSFIKMILNPLILKYDISIYVVSPDEIYDSYLNDKIKPVKIWHPEASKNFVHIINDLKDPNNFGITCYRDGNTQLGTFSYGAKKLLEEKTIGDFDYLLVLRIDMLYKKNINEWKINFDTMCLFPFYETSYSSKRAPDCIYWINKRSDDGVKKFLNIITDYDFPHELHGLIGKFDLKNVKYDFMVKECYVSGTHGPATCCKNPFYALSGRRYLFDDFSHDTLYSQDWNPDWANKFKFFGAG